MKLNTKKISFLRLDTDFYESTIKELEILYPRLEKGGVLLIDDYGFWDGARKAVDEYLNFISNTKIGDDIPSQLYSAVIINNKIYFGVTNFTDINLVKIYNSNNELESTFEVGLFPGDFAYWEFEEN